MSSNELTLDGIVGQLTTFELRDYDNNLGTMGNALKSSLTISNLKKEKTRKEESESKTKDDLDEIEAFFARRLSRGKGKYKVKLPLICFKCNEVGHFAAKSPNIRNFERNDRN